MKQEKKRLLINNLEYFWPNVTASAIATTIATITTATDEPNNIRRRGARHGDAGVVGLSCSFSLRPGRRYEPNGCGTCPFCNSSVDISVW